MAAPAVPTIKIDMDKPCAECRKGGAAGNGLCLNCVNRAMSGRRMFSAEGRAVQARVFQASARAATSRAATRR